MTNIRKLAEKLIDESDKELQEIRKILKETYKIEPNYQNFGAERQTGTIRQVLYNKRKQIGRYGRKYSN